ncbi:MAG: CBS domain-containing protein [Polyangiaceae bacterium]|nr:CBS domain-containing protein [Polyangiaceae bacterium]
MGDFYSTPVQEYMSKSLISVRPTASLADVLETLRSRDVSSVAVTDDAGSLLGVVSMTDLLRVAHIRHESAHEAPTIVPPQQTAASIMRSPAITIEESETVQAAAARMVENRIHRVVVLRHGKAVAVFSTRDMMRVVLFHHIETPLSEIMTSPVETIGVGESIDEAIERLTEKNLRGLVVVDDQWPVGVFTQTEALTSRALPAAVRRMPVEEVMSYEILALDVRTPLYRVAGQAVATRARRVIAVELGSLKGIVTGFDLAKIATMTQA